MRRSLRIAASVFFGTCCLLLIALWIRSFSYEDGAGIAVPHNCEAWVDSVRSRLLVSVRHETEFPVSPSPRWSERVDPESLPTIERNTGPRVLGFGVVHEPGFFRLRLPHWFLAFLFVVSASLAWCPWRWRFRLRTLLITMTLLALGLGIIAIGSGR